MVVEIGVVALLILLAFRVLVESGQSESAARMSEYLIVPIIPLLIMFVIILILKTMEIIG